MVNKLYVYERMVLGLAYFGMKYRLGSKDEQIWSHMLRLEEFLL